MRVCFDSDDNSRRWAWTEGLAAFGQQEIAVPLSWMEDPARAQQVVRLLEFVGSYVAR